MAAEMRNARGRIVLVGPGSARPATAQALRQQSSALPISASILRRVLAVHLRG
jgi:hypothetical protein